MFGNMKLMTDYLQTQSIPTFGKIRQSHVSFRSLQKNHRRHIDVNDVFHTIERWKKLQEFLKLVNINNDVVCHPYKIYKNDKFFLLNCGLP